MRPFSAVVPKELVPIGSVPALWRVVAEAVEAGIDEIAIVRRREKPLLEELVDRMSEESAYADLRVTWVEQASPKGLGDAIALCRDFAAGEPFALLLPDNVPLAPDHRLRPMLEMAEAERMDVFGLIELGHRHSGLYGRSGRLELEEQGGGRYLVTRLHDKSPGKLQVAPGERVLRACGRMVCQPHVFDYIELVRPTVTGAELDEVPAYQRIVADHRALGWLLPGPVFDVGHPEGVLAASSWLHARARG